MSKNQKMIYKIIGQTEAVTITGLTKYAVTPEQAEKDVHLVIKEKFKTKPYVILPIATQEAWDNGYINFCPRCGSRIELEDSYSRFECWECNAEIDCNITTYEEEQEDDEM